MYLDLNLFILLFIIIIIKNKKILRDGELNPGLPRDRRGYSPLYYLGFII
jgi:hypothetical protein